MNKNKNGSKSNNKHKAKKIIKLIIYIILLVLLAFISVKSCNITLKALTPTALSWDEINNVNIICEESGALVGTLDPDEYYYMNNGNDENGYTNTPAFSIYDSYTGLQYDEIRIRRNSIILRGYLYDSLDNFSDYYDRKIWGDDFISDEITPDTIRFENITQSRVENIALFSLNFMQNGPAEFLQLINNNFNYADNYINIYNDSFKFPGLAQPLEVNTSIFVDYSTTENYIKNIKIDIEVIKGGTTNNIIKTISNSIDYNLIINNTYNANYMIKKYCQASPTAFIYEFYYNNANNQQQVEIINVDSGWYSSFILQDEINNNVLYQQPLIDYMNEQQRNAGYGEGYRLGREVGEEVGYNTGYQDGYGEGASGQINTSWVLSLMNTATSILNIEILPNIKLIYLVGAFIILAFVRFVIGWIR